MAHLSEINEYEEGIYQLETTDPVVAGPNGISNRQAKQLANRTAWLKQQIDKLISDVDKLGVTDVTGLQAALNSKLDVMGKATDSERLDGKCGKVYAPPGAVIAFAADTPPEGWLECNGAALSRISYANLFSVIGTVFGEGNGLTTFNLPDLRGEFIRGFDNGRGIDKKRLFGSWQKPTVRAANYDASSRNIMDFDEQGYMGEDDVRSKFGYEDPDWNGYTGNINFMQISEGIGYGSVSASTFLHAIRPRNMAMLFCIKY
ncbi:phage tail protein [Zooshikella harenae]|uniref:Tail fiber protein n=1 Tax=Zooshikella harenae TaxID=2827238 RepID=A0ABS5ZIT1_9GAMM|nr:phage tail protein [Zooshikella harenae]MBU2713788.1 tail fiber protein [Zooshikella harenae]